MSATSMAITKLSSIVQQLAEQAKLIDNENHTNKAHKMIENNAIFSLNIFSTDSDCFMPYIYEVTKKISALTRLVQANQNELAKRAIEKIEQQIQALHTALNANSCIHDNAKISLDAKIKSIKARQYKKVVQSITHSSQALYQKLSQHHEYERRLQNMLTERQQQLAHCNKSQNQSLSEQVLTLHQRLGRCRKAISIIERDIEFSEKR